MKVKFNFETRIVYKNSLAFMGHHSNLFYFSFLFLKSLKPMKENLSNIMLTQYTNLG